MLLVFINIKCSHAVIVDMSTVRISKGPGLNVVYSRAQCGKNTYREAVQGRLLLSLGRHAPSKYQYSRRACQNREFSRRRLEIAESRSHLAKCSMRGSPPPHPALLAFPNIK